MQSNVEYLPSVRKQEDLEEWILYNSSNNWPDLPAQARVFAYEYSIVGSLRDACGKVSIGRQKGTRLLKDPLVDAFILDLQKEMAARSIFTREWIELEQLEQYEKCNGTVEVPYVTRDGDMVMACNFQAGAANAALKNIMDTSGVTRGTLESGGVSINIDLSAFVGDPTPPNIVSEQ
jgi:hypothetical protein